MAPCFAGGDTDTNSLASLFHRMTAAVHGANSSSVNLYRAKPTSKQTIGGLCTTTTQCLSDSNRVAGLSEGLPTLATSVITTVAAIIELYFTFKQTEAPMHKPD